MALQLFHGMWRYTDDDGPKSRCSFWNQDCMRAIPAFAQRHPDTMRDVFLATRIPSHEAASIALAELVEDGLMTLGDALSMAKKLLHDNAKRIYCIQFPIRWRTASYSRMVAACATLSESAWPSIEIMTSMSACWSQGLLSPYCSAPTTMAAGPARSTSV